MLTHFRIHVALVTFCCLVGIATPGVAADSSTQPSRIALAQTPSSSSSNSDSAEDKDSAAVESDNRSTLEEIVVTASKRAELLSKAPLAVSALTPDQLKESGVVGLVNLTSAVPNVEMRTVSFANSIAVTIRGVTNADFNHGGDPAVATYIDGVYVGRTQGLLGDLYDLERVEILRGPQGTLYGRNATGGNINVITADPTNSFDASADFSYGNYGDAQARGMLNLPVTDTLAVRGAFMVHRSDGYIETQGTTTRNYAAADDFGGRLTALWTPVDSFKWRLSVDDLQAKGSPGLDFDTAPDGTPSDGLPVFDRPVPSFPEPSNDIDNLMIRSRMDGQLSDALSLAYIAGYQRLIYNADAGTTTGQVFDSRRDDKADSHSHEINLNYDAEKLRNILGATYFYMDNKTHQAYHFYNIDTYFASNDQVISEAWGVFDQATYSLTDRLRVIAGVRYSSETKQIEGLNLSFCPINLYPNTPFATILSNHDAGIVNPNCGTAKQPSTRGKWSNVSWKAGVEHDLSDDTLTYLTVTTGFKSGGVNAGIVGEDATFLPEEVANYELGMKSRLLNDQLSLNANLFYEDYQDIQVSQLVASGTAQVTTNAASAAIYGVELEGQWRITPNDHLSGFLTYLRATYEDYKDAVDQQTSIGGLDLTDNDLPHAPKFSARLQYARDFDLANGGTLAFIASGYYQAKSYLREFNYPVDLVGSYSKGALNLRYLDPTDRWTITAYADNLSDKVVRSGSYTLLGEYFSSYNPPRTYGVRISYQY